MNEFTPQAETVTHILLMVFRMNGRLLDGGDTLVKSLGINSARWQVLGAVALAGKPLTVPQIAETMGITRQGAQKQLNKMVSDGFLVRQSNPHHERSPVHALTEKGQRTFDEAMDRERFWATRLAEDLTWDDLQHALDVLNRLYQRLGSPVLGESL